MINFLIIAHYEYIINPKEENIIVNVFFFKEGLKWT